MPKKRVSKPFVVACDSRVELLAHAFVSAFCSLYADEVDEDDLVGFDRLLEGVAKCVEEQFRHLHIGLTRGAATPMPRHSEVFIRTMKACYDLLAEEFYPWCHSVEQTPLKEYISDFLDLYNDDMAAYEVLGDRLCPRSHVALYIAPLFSRNGYSPWLEFEIRPIYAPGAGFLSCGKNPFPLAVAHTIGLHVDPSSRADRLKYKHYHGMRGGVFHELISHCSFAEIEHSSFDRGAVAVIPNCDYIAHGWLSLYAFRVSDVIHMTERKIAVPLNWDKRNSKSYEHLLVRKMKKLGKADAVEGYEDAKSVFDTLVIYHSEINQVVQEAGVPELLKNTSNLPMERAVYVLQKVLQSCIGHCMERRQSSEAQKALKTLTAAIRRGEIGEKNSDARVGLVSLFQSDFSSLKPLIDGFERET